MGFIRYNSPVILSFSLVAVAIHFVSWMVSSEITMNFFVVRPFMSLTNPLDYFRLVSHVLGHSSWQHLFGNLTYILLLGPLLEEKYGSGSLLVMICLTALFTGIINVVFLSQGLLGASGIVFMLIILASIVDIRDGSIPLTFILVVAIFISGEVLNAFRQDHISQMAHIAGGTLGAVFGFLMAKPLKTIKTLDRIDINTEV